MSALLPVLTLLIGVALVARTLIEGGGATAYGILIGALFILAGGLRLWLARRSSP